MNAANWAETVKQEHTLHSARRSIAQWSAFADDEIIYHLQLKCDRNVHLSIIFCPRPYDEPINNRSPLNNAHIGLVSARHVLEKPDDISRCLAFQMGLPQLLHYWWSCLGAEKKMSGCLIHGIYAIIDGSFVLSTIHANRLIDCSKAFAFGIN